jgi:ABC-type transport system involved in multi-copper enzyme maturation permease subunit
MTRTAVWSPALAKEIRGLLPLWGASVAALAAAFMWGKGALLDAGLLAYVAGSIAIGAQSIGQEYTYRTLPMLLALPADRRRTYVHKFVVSAVMMLALAALARPVFADRGHPESWQFTLVVFTILSGLFLAPLLTMVCRSSLAGMILAGSVPGCLWFVMLAGASLWFGIDADEAAKLIRDPWMLGMLLLCPAAGFLGWRRFAALEATEAAAPALHLPRWLRRARGARRHSPLVALVAKELHLQQLAMVVVALNITGWGSLVLAQPYIRGLSTFPVGAVGLLYCMGLAIMIGALASAEERHHGALEWQLLQPTPAWQQWMVKVAVSFGLALVFSVGLPVLLIQLTPHESFPAIRISGHLTVLVVVLTASSLYISSLCSSGVRAMVLSLPIGMAVAYFIQMVSVALGWVTRVFAGPWMADIVTGAVAPPSVDPADIMIFAARALSLTLAPLLLWFGFVNHTSSERTVRRVCQQVASIALVIMAGMILVGGVLAFHELRSR